MDEVARAQLQIILSKLDLIMAEQMRAGERLAAIEAQETADKLDNLINKHTDLDKRVVSLETKNMLTSGGVSAVTAGVITYITNLISGGGFKG